MTYYDSWEQMRGLPLFPMTRTEGPETSRNAADRVVASGVVGNHYRRILAALKLGAAGASEIGRRADMEPHRVGKRTGEMRRLGMIEYTGRTVKNQTGGHEAEYRLATHMESDNNG